MIKRLNKEINDIIPKKLVELNLDEDFSIFENQGIRISTDNTDNISVFVIDKKNSNFEMQIDVSQQYPFKPPKVLINSGTGSKRRMKTGIGMEITCNWVDYNRWSSQLLKNNNHINNINVYENAILFSKIKRPLLKKYWSLIPIITFDTCLCCNTYLCTNNWTPSNTLLDIVCEYIVRKDFQIYVKNMHRKLISGIFTNLPDDVIYHIVELL